MIKNLFDPPLDSGIKNAVLILCENGIETFESCQGGTNHAYPGPTIRFHGDRVEGLRAYAIAARHGLNVASLSRVYDVLEGELVGPYWEITLIPNMAT